MDSHQYWPEDDQKKRQEIENQWQGISEQMETDMETFSKEAASESGSLVDQIRVENRQRIDVYKRQVLSLLKVLQKMYRNFIPSCIRMKRKSRYLILFNRFQMILPI